MAEDLHQEYAAAIGSVIDARKQYKDACAVHGEKSWAAEQAHDYLRREIEHRNEVRQRYDVATGA